MLSLVAVFRWPSTWCEHRTRSRRAGPEEAPSATLAALREQASIQPPKTDVPTQRCIKRTFHHHVEVVNGVSTWVLGFTHVLPSITLLHFRQDQKPTIVVKFCPWRQLLSHFHPIHFWSGTTTGNMVICIVRRTTQTVSEKRSRTYTYNPPGIHSSCSSSPFNTTFSVWTPGGSNMLGILTVGASGAGNATITTLSEAAMSLNFQDADF